jgi:hypothetical protein
MAKTRNHVRIKGDTITPLNCVLYSNGNPVNLAAYTVKFEYEEEDGTVLQAATTTGVTAHPTQTFTALASTDLLTCNGHGLQDGDQIIVATQTTLPGGLTASTRYFARDVTPNAFRLAETPGGINVNLTDAGTGTHTFYVVGSVQYDFQSGDVDAAGRFRGWFTTVSGSEIQTYPNDDEGIVVEVLEKGS